MILSPSEYELLRENSKKEENQINLDVVLMMGCRYVEAVQIQKHPSWFDGERILFPGYPIIERSRLPRTIRLSYACKERFRDFIHNKRLGSLQNWNSSLRRWYGRKGISAKTLRETYEGWLSYTLPFHKEDIENSQGHPLNISYNDLRFLRKEEGILIEYTKNWF